MAVDWREKWHQQNDFGQRGDQTYQGGQPRVHRFGVWRAARAGPALVETGSEAEDTELMNVLTMGVAPYTDPKFASRFRANAFFIGNSVREAVSEARADYTPVFFSQIPGMFKSGRIPIDVALIMVSPPDEHGFCSLGVSVDMTRPAALAAKLLIAQVNSHMPRTLGNSFIHVRDIEYLVEHNEPLLEWPVISEPDEVTARIADNVASLVSDGDTLQLGIGRLPDTVLLSLTDRNDLGIHTEMFSDGVMRLTEKGVITGNRKTVHQGKTVGSFAAGSQELFCFLHNNPQIEMHPSEYTNDPRVIAQHDNIVAINAAIEVDLTGQAVADSIGERLYSGIGGHADFMRGAAMARGGKPVLALPSTVDRQGRLRPQPHRALLAAGRRRRHHARRHALRGHRIRRRLLAWQDDAGAGHGADPRRPPGLPLRTAACRQTPPPGVRRPNPAVRPSLSRRTGGVLPLDDGTQVIVRPIRPVRRGLHQGHVLCVQRADQVPAYHGTLKSMPHNKLQMFCNVDYDTEMALVVVRGKAGHEEIIGVGRYMTARRTLRRNGLRGPRRLAAQGLGHPTCSTG